MSMGYAGIDIAQPQDSLSGAGCGCAGQPACKAMAGPHTRFHQTAGNYPAARKRMVGSRCCGITTTNPCLVTTLARLRRNGAGGAGSTRLYQFGYGHGIPSQCTATVIHHRRKRLPQRQGVREPASKAARAPPAPSRHRLKADAIRACPGLCRAKLMSEGGENMLSGMCV